ncbi:MAG: SUMF1/EgtB/PvdO family nonheme iron enzyme [Desulfobacterales bacterium]|nr:SUMF1/EgtB/PvdO family nonheme iron enzyme [Desulfobacterales bacterium]
MTITYRYYHIIWLVLIVLFSTTSYADIHNGLIAYYPFDGNANDASGNGHDGTVVGASLTYDRFGAANRAYLFDGQDDYIDLGNSKDFQMSTWTITGWFFVSKKPINPTGIITKDENKSSKFNYALMLYSDLTLISEYETCSSETNQSIRTPVKDGEWIFFTMVRNQETSKQILYVNGQEKNSMTGDTPCVDGDGHVFIGYAPYDLNPFDYFNGSIDDIRIYNRALSMDEITSLYIDEPVFQEPDQCEAELTMNLDLNIFNIYFDTSVIPLNLWAQLSYYPVAKDITFILTKNGNADPSMLPCEPAILSANDMTLYVPVIHYPTTQGIFSFWATFTIIIKQDAFFFVLNEFGEIGIDPNDLDHDADSFSVNQGDCNDSDAAIYPQAYEIANDGIDQDCSGEDFMFTQQVITNSLGMTFIEIPDGTFMMGSPNTEKGRHEDETLHQVTLTQSYLLQTTEVSQAQWKTLMKESPSHHENCPNCPVENISWNDIQDFIEKLNSLGEGQYRLPTEAEWEYAARVGTSKALVNGDMKELYCGYDPNLYKMGWYCGNSDHMPHAVGEKNSNKWGIYDMHGNVWEWCQDKYNLYLTEPQIDPVNVSTDNYRVIRGGSYYHHALFSRSACRDKQLPDFRAIHLGFRLVKSTQ